MLTISLICPNGKAVTHKVKEAAHYSIDTDCDGLRTVKFWAEAPEETVSSLVRKGALNLVHDQEDLDELPTALRAALSPKGLISILSVPQTFVIQITPIPQEAPL